MNATPGTDPLAAYVTQQVEAVLDGLAQLPDADAVHRTRLALRRLRSTLRVFADQLDLTSTDRPRIDAELRRLARLLGAVRDPQQQRARFAAALDGLPPEQVLGAVRARIDDTLSAEQQDAQRTLVDTLASERHAAFVAVLESWREHPPVLGTDGDGLPEAVRNDVAKAARKAVGKTVEKAVKKAAKKADRRLAEACATGTDAELHRARRAAKRARHAAEVLGETGGGRKARKRFKRVQELLGEQHDATAAAATLRRIATGVPAGDTGFTLGLLHEREHRRAEELRRRICADSDG